MPDHPFPLSLEGESHLPPSRRLVLAVERAIEEGRLRPGSQLPGSRVLAERLGMNRNTVIAALRALEAEGWLVSEANRGTFVADPPPVRRPDPEPALAASASSPNFDLPSRLNPLSPQDPDAIALADGLPDPALFPAAELAKAYQRGLQRHGDRLLHSAEPMGNGLLRETLAQWLREQRGLPVLPGQILVTRGTRMALSLLGRAILREGSVLGVECPGNRPAWEALLPAPKVEFRPIPVDQAGLDLEALERILSEESLRALYLTPRRQNPTGRVLAPERRRRLLELASAHRIALIEEDLDADIAYEEDPVPPLAGEAGGRQVIYLGSLSRLMAPGLRLGFIVAPQPLVERLARLQQRLAWQGDGVLEWAVADLIRDGILARHLRRVKKVYQERRDHLLARLEPHRGARLRFEKPAGGLALWVEGAEGVDLEGWVRAARALGLVLHPPSHFRLQGPGNGTRIAFSQADTARLDQAMDRWDLAWQRLTAG